MQHVGLIATSREVSVSRVWSLPLSLECGTDPGLSSLNEVLHARWSSPDLTVVGNSSQNGVWQQFTETQKLWISHISNNTQQGFFTCNYTVNSVNHIAGFTLNTTGNIPSCNYHFLISTLTVIFVHFDEGSKGSTGIHVCMCTFQSIQREVVDGYLQVQLSL